MSFFKFNDKEGPGVEKDEKPAPQYVRFFKVFFLNLSKMVGLNLLYFFACLPVITIGPATAAMYYIMRNFYLDKHVDAFYDFCRKSKEHFKQGVIVTLIDIVLGAGIVFAVLNWRYLEMGTVMTTVAYVALFFLAYFLIFGNLYLFPMMASFDLPLKKLIRNSLILASGKIFRNIAMLLFDGVIIFLCVFFFPMSVPLGLALAFSLCFWFNTFMVFPVFKKHIMAVPEEPSDDSSEKISEPTENT